ncbi:MAG: hypothetical protein ACI89L_001211 [Phycisphaerales bacterium]|jgi:hypothetical protein
MIRSSTTLLAVLAAAGTVAVAQPVTYDFSGTLGDHFAQFIDAAVINSQQAAGVLRFDTGGVTLTGFDQDEGYVHVGFAPSYAESWTASVDFTFPLSYDTNYTSLLIDQWIGMGIAAVFDDGVNPFSSIDAAIEVWDGAEGFGGYRGFLTDAIFQDVDGPSEEADATGVTSGTLTLTFDACTRTMTTSSGGLVIGQVDLDAPGSDWGMTDTDVFLIGLYTGFENRGAGAGEPMTFDNFTAEIIEPDAAYQFDGVLGSNFTLINDEPTVSSGQGGGELRFDTDDQIVGDVIDVYAHNTFMPRFDESWQASIEYRLPLGYDSNYTPSTTTVQGVGLGLGAIFTDGLSFFDGFAVNAEVWSDGVLSPNPRRQYYTSLFLNDNDFPESEVSAAGVEDGVLRLTFDANTKVICAVNGSGVELLCADLDAPGTDLGMADSDTFLVGVFGGATNRWVSPDERITIDNFCGFILPTPEPTCTADLNGDGILDNGDIQTFVQFFLGGNLVADMNGDGILDNGDIQTFVLLFLAGC